MRRRAEPLGVELPELLVGGAEGLRRLRVALAGEPALVLHLAQLGERRVGGGPQAVAELRELEGTVRRLLLEVCEREGIPVVLTPPQLADAARWEGAMISSTSRLLLPVDELYVPQPGACAEEADRVRRFDNGDGSLAAAYVEEPHLTASLDLASPNDDPTHTSNVPSSLALALTPNHA